MKALAEISGERSPRADVHDLRKATFDARRCLRSEGIGVQVRDGLLRVVDVAYGSDGRSRITPLSGWFGMDDVVDLLEGGVRCPRCGWLRGAQSCACGPGVRR